MGCIGCSRGPLLCCEIPQSTTPNSCSLASDASAMSPVSQAASVAGGTLAKQEKTLDTMKTNELLKKTSTTSAQNNMKSSFAGRNLRWPLQDQLCRLSKVLQLTTPCACEAPGVPVGKLPYTYEVDGPPLCYFM